METPQYTVRLPDDIKELLDRKAGALRLNFTKAVQAAIREWAGGPPDVAEQQSAVAVAALEAQLEEARDELARVTAEFARVTGTPAGAGSRFADAVSKEQALAAYLAAATGAVPATPKGASVMSGYRHLHVQYVLTAMTRHGYLDRPAFGKYVPVPGMDIDQGVREALKEVSAASMARKAAGAAKAASPTAAPAGPAAVRTAPSRAKNAAREKARNTPGAATPAARTGKRAAQRAVREAAEEGSPRREPVLSVAASPDRAAAVVQAAREAGHDVRTASELAAVPVGAAMFQPPGGEKVITGLAPEVPDHSGKPGLDDAPPGRPRGRARKRCEHRLPPGAWCKTCQQPK